jgi:hypothetical protein
VGGADRVGHYAGDRDLGGGPNVNDDLRNLLRHLTARNLLMALLVLTAWALAIILVAWVAAQAWQSS